MILMALLLGMLLILPATPAYVDHTEDAGYALSFDGNNDYVELHETAQVMGSGWEETKTVSLWVKPTDMMSCHVDPAQCDFIFGERPRWWGISIGERNGEDKIWVWNYDSGYDVVGVDYSLNTWVHVTLVHSNGVLRAYRNGEEVGSTPSGATGRPTDTDPILYLGGIIVNETENWTFAGVLDEVRLWNYARTEAQVQADMYHSLNGDEAGLMAYYKMSDGSGLTLTDDTGNGWDGTLNDGGNGVPPDGSPPQWVGSDVFDDPPTPTPTNTDTPTPTATNTVTNAPTPGSSPTPTPTNTPTPGPSPTPTLGPSPTSTPTFTPGPDSTSTPTAIPGTATPVIDNPNFVVYLPMLEKDG